MKESDVALSLALGAIAVIWMFGVGGCLDKPKPAPIVVTHSDSVVVPAVPVVEPEPAVVLEPEPDPVVIQPAPVQQMVCTNGQCRTVQVQRSSGFSSRNSYSRPRLQPLRRIFGRR